jgi:hypothetical protein
MPSTYDKIATTTLGSTSTQITFSSITGTYTDLILISNVRPTTSGFGYINLQFNSDSSAVYSRTYLNGDGSTASSGRNTGETVAYIYGNQIFASPSTFITQIQNYSNSTTFKTLLTRTSDSGNIVNATVNLWRSTSAITRIDVNSVSDSFATGSTFTLYGIKAA